MKRLALISFAIATGAVVSAIEGTPIIDASAPADAQECATFPQKPNPEAELGYLLSNPSNPICSSARDPYEAYQSERGKRKSSGVEVLLRR